MRTPLAILAALVLLSTSDWSSQDRPGTQKPAPPPAVQTVPLPNADGSLKIGVLGDFGDASTRQYEVAAQMAKSQATFRYELVLLTGDNLYGSERPQDFDRKFARPYKSLLDAGVKFYASLGNHDSREQRYYKPFNMDGKLYYSFKGPKQSVRFIALESTYPEPVQIAWLEQELKNAKEDWKIVFFHHPLVLVRRTPWIGHGTARHAGAAFRHLRCQHRLRRARPFLRAGQATERDSSFRGRIGRPVARREHRSEHGDHSRGARHRQRLPRR